MSNDGRKSLVREIRRSLLNLSAEELFEIAKAVGPIPGRDVSDLEVGNEDDCFDFINGFMCSKSLLESEDMGMVKLLVLNDTITAVIQNREVAHTPSVSLPSTLTPPNPPHSTTTDMTQTTVVNAVHNISDVDHQRLLSQFEELGRQLRQCKVVPAPHSMQLVEQAIPANDPSHIDSELTTQHTVNQSAPLHANAQPAPSLSVHQAAPHQAQDRVVSLQDLSYLPRREFKIQGGQIDDNTSDISYNNVCRQIDEGVRQNFSNAELVRGVLRILKPGTFKDMLMNNDDMTLAELKGFLQSHLGEKNSTELVQELMCTQQKENETPQQFMYRVIGLKQRILFTSKQADGGIKYHTDTVQDVFLHTIYQGMGHKYNDLRRELKPLLADRTVTDETILRQVMKLTSDESERQRRLGSTSRQKHTHAHSAQVEADPPKVSTVQKENPERKKQNDVIQQLTEKVEALTKMVESLKRPVQPVQSELTGQQPTRAQVQPGQRGERPYGCPKCIEQNRPDCSHCFACGEEGHRAVGCLRKAKQSGNGGRSLWRDRQ